MDIFKPQSSNAQVNISLQQYVTYIQQQMNQTGSMLAGFDQTVEQQTKREKILSRQLVTSCL